MIERLGSGRYERENRRSNGFCEIGKKINVSIYVVLCCAVLCCGGGLWCVLPRGLVESRFKTRTRIKPDQECQLLDC
ncbi:hypothetical protein EYC84_007121 [Monilinia fructicola]|uniref:Uncharacterized protein n=1 Tax=Monilinia fructicola TaxID=38448 RepID=A0A5M9K8D1_MONFR|nr:hypothetical protein EYC84_007121 [Monilinia fructicola]